MMRRWGLLVAFVLVITAANLLTSELGMVTWLGLMATAGTWLAGFGLVARDALHDAAGLRWVLAAIAIGVVVSVAFSPQLALASGGAVALSELADLAVYSPLRRRGRTRAALASNVVGSVVDTVAFLWIAGFPLDGTPTQVAIKVGTTTLFVLGVRLALPRQSVQSAGGGRNE